MNVDDNDQQRPTPARPGDAARSLLVRCWIEWDFDTAPRLRGTVRDVSETPNRMLGAFETLAGLSALLGTVLADVEDQVRPR